MTSPEATTYHLNSIMFDHLPLLMYVRPSYWEKRKRQFLFEEMWTIVEGCQETITYALEYEHGTVVEKLKACQGSLWTWNNEQVGRIPTKLWSLQSKLDDIQTRSYSPVVEYKQKNISREMLWKRDGKRCCGSRDSVSHG
ncbi:hypothetical protein L3X38_032590 [Prunus dulcis]|uniref:Uncharacterized protein n=1 Tax=Prunus dulcis TaxID=3755 RepID=A0AAD4VFG9_PRUDU|nr:hypothetical protein L3X38_032590 [Prunus dulcis]